MRPYVLLPLSALAAVVAVACRPLVCTEMACTGSLVLTILADRHPVELFAGTVTVGGRTFEVDCTGEAEASPEVTCGEGEVTIHLDGEPTDEVSWNLQGWDPADPDADPAPYTGQDAATPEWTEFSPNGEGCPPTCQSAELTITLGVLD